MTVIRMNEQQQHQAVAVNVSQCATVREENAKSNAQASPIGNDIYIE